MTVSGLHSLNGKRKVIGSAVGGKPHNVLQGFKKKVPDAEVVGFMSTVRQQKYQKSKILVSFKYLVAGTILHRFNM